MDVFCSSELGTIAESNTGVASAVKRTKAMRTIVAHYILQKNFKNQTLSSCILDSFVTVSSRCNVSIVVYGCHCSTSGICFIFKFVFLRIPQFTSCSYNMPGNV